ncbi:MAG TPA: glycosyltransferase family 87 protein [Rhizomicrobium sp.]|nr:glycosyltransferase family 87 protein [Rhizomicrobium sp.]
MAGILSNKATALPTVDGNIQPVAVSSQSQPTIRSSRNGPALSAAALGIVAGYAAILAIMFYRHEWILAPDGKPIASDFIAYWAAGLTALSGRAGAAYDIAAQHALQNSLSGPFPNYYYWNYPPPFFFVAALLGALPYTAGFFLWMTTTGAAFALAIRSIATRRLAIVVACASPAALINTFVGQGGFLTAALLGAGLAVLPRRPLLAGMFFGLMAYKPQFGILIPFVLLAGGYWRAILSAGGTILVASAAAALAFGAASYLAFLHALPVISQTTLSFGGEGWSKIESFYSIARFAGAGERAAWMVQGATILVCAAAAIWLWRRNVPYALKAAGLVVAAMLATPYLHEYDFPMLLVAFAFLWQDAAFDRADWALFAAANLLMAAFLAQLAPIGPPIILLAGAMIGRRLALLYQAKTGGFRVAPEQSAAGCGNAVLRQ